MVREIRAKFNSKCSETGAMIKKGELILWDKSKKAVYCENSQYSKEYYGQLASADFDQMVYDSWF